MRRRKNNTSYTYKNPIVPIDILNYDYNIRGWLHGINKNYAENTGQTGSWFGMELSYDYGFTSAQFNGNIAGERWRSKGDGEQRAYGFNYDMANRLTSADYNQLSGSNWDKTKTDFSTSNLTYDLNGNILTMNQMGMQLSTISQIDQLQYGYISNSNQLDHVHDASSGSNSTSGDFKEITHDASTDYTYDVNGNLLTDKNKAINSAITYDYLNQPLTVPVNGKGTITYTYDASGNKLRKVTVDNTVNPSVSTTTDYIGPFTYINDTLQYITTEEGRARPTSHANDTVYYDYFEKDHLGNVRVVLTDQKQIDYYPVADVEKDNASAMNVETQYYTIANDASHIIAANTVGGWTGTGSENYQNNNNNTSNTTPPYNTNPYTTTSSTSTYLYKLNGQNGSKTGLGITLKVMSGDVIDIYGYSYYHTGGVNPDNTDYTITGTSGALANLLSSFAGSAALSATHSGLTGTTLSTNNATAGPLTTWLSDPSRVPSNQSTPRAYINWVFLDEQLNTVTGTGMTGCDPVSDLNNHLKSHHKTVTITKNGYLYIYCSDESNMDVFFDNLQVVDTHGPLVEETHYYPFGLTMSGISSQALNFGTPENNKLYNKGSELQHHEFSDGSGLELYATNFRSLDPQLGRWWQIDPKPDLAESPYSSMGNNPILHNDPLGDTVNLSGLYVSKDGEAAKNKIIADLSAQTGLTLSEDDQGNLQYKTTKDKNGNDVAVVAKNKKGKNIGSATARNLITGAISDKRTVSVGVNNAGTGSKTSGLNIFLDTKQIDGFINGASRNLNPKTLGFGMTFMHELLHTDMEGALSDDKTAFGQTGAVVDKMNIIRSELGADYGQRLSYQGAYFNTATKLPYYIPFDSNSFTDLSNGNVPNGNDMYIEVK